MKTHWPLSILLVLLGLATGAAGMYFGHLDDSPGLGMLGFILMAVLITLGVKRARRPV